jgi:hypothetical protein
MNRKILYLGLIAGVVLFSSCRKEVMDRTVFIPDEYDNKLPAYTEWGYNSFGAEYERDYFLVSSQIEPCKVLYDNYQLQFSLHGTNHNGNMTLVFLFSTPDSLAMRDFKDLGVLNNKKIVLSDTSACKVKMILQDSNEVVLNISEGELYFKRSQLLRIDEKINRVILSGTFDLRFMKGNFPSYISKGRFDVGITPKIFTAKN